MPSQTTLRAAFALSLWLLSLTLVGCSGDSADPQPPAFSGASLPEEDALRERIDKVLDFTRDRHMDSREHAAWQILHGVLAYGEHLKITHDGKLVDCLDWLLAGGEINGFILRPGDRGLDSVVEPGSKTGQGHDDQWLKVFAKCALDWDHPIVWQGQQYKMGDLVTEAQWDIRDGAEASWTLIGLASYLPPKATWTAGDGQEWSIERVVAMEADQDLNSSACGGTHRLIGLTIALNHYLAEHPDEPLTGGWKAAEEVVQNAVKTFKAHQQPDGLFSCQYLVRPASTSDIALQINTSGHTLEFLTFALPQDELSKPWVSRAAIRICEILEATRDMPVECGALYHAAHGLQIYRARRWGERPDYPGSTRKSPAGDAAPAPPAPTPPVADDAAPAPSTASLE